MSRVSWSYELLSIKISVRSYGVKNPVRVLMCVYLFQNLKRCVDNPFEISKSNKLLCMEYNFDSTQHFI
jgi:hypothetical protein